MNDPTLDSFTLWQLLENFAQNNPQKSWLHFLDLKSPLAELQVKAFYDATQQCASWLFQKGVKKRDVVFLPLPNGPEFLIAFMAITSLGAQAAPLPPPMLGKQSDPSYFIAYLIRLAKDASPALLLFDPKLYEQVIPLLPNDLAQRSYHTRAWINHPKVDFPKAHPNDIALLQYTSGSQYKLKGIQMTHQALIHNVKGITQRLNLSEHEIALSWLPLYQDMGLVGVFLSSLYAQFQTYWMRPEAFLLRPQLWIQRLSQFKVSLTAAPSFAYQIVLRRVRDRHLKNPELNLSHCHAILNGAETVYPHLVSAFEQKFKAYGLKAHVSVPAYGLAENGLAVTMAKPLTPMRWECIDALALYRDAQRKIVPQDHPNATPAVSVGTPLIHQKVQIWNDEDQPLPEGKIGQIVVQSPSQMSGYRNRTALHSKILVRGWLKTGDLGYLLQEELFFAGRKKDIVIKRGRNYEISDVIHVFQKIFETLKLPLKATAFALPDPKQASEKLVAVLWSEQKNLKLNPKALHKEINGELLADLGLMVDLFVWSDHPLTLDHHSKISLAKKALIDLLLQRAQGL